MRAAHPGQSAIDAAASWNSKAAQSRGPTTPSARPRPNGTTLLASPLPVSEPEGLRSVDSWTRVVVIRVRVYLHL